MKFQEFCRSWALFIDWDGTFKLVGALIFIYFGFMGIIKTTLLSFSLITFLFAYVILMDVYHLYYARRFYFELKQQKENGRNNK
jgi:hypothetical protein